MVGIEDASLQTALDRLAEANILLVQGLPPEADYRFKHALIAEAWSRTPTKLGKNSPRTVVEAKARHAERIWKRPLPADKRIHMREMATTDRTAGASS